MEEKIEKPGVIKLKINLENMPLSIFRRVLVPQDVNMMQLHFIIQIAMGWEFAHLFQFSDKQSNANIHVKIPYEGFDNFPYRVDTYKPEEIILNKEFQIKRGSKPFWYWYDFGDDWWHKITFQKPTKKDMALYDGKPVCVDAFGACPPEDVGGPWGYDNFLNAITNKKHPEHKETREWIGLGPREKYEPEYVNIHAVNKGLVELFTSDYWKITSENYFND